MNKSNSQIMLRIACSLNLVLYFLSAFAQPSNNDCSSAILLSFTKSCTYTQYSNLNATYSGDATASCGGTPTTDVWFKFVVPASGNISINTQRVNFYSAMALYTGSCGSLTQYICDDNSNSSYLMPFIEFHDKSIAGDTLYLQYWGNNATSGDFKLCVFEPEQPSNHSCDSAISLSVQSACTVSYFTNAHAGNSGVAAPSCNTTIYDDVWFDVKIPSSGRLIVRTQNNGISNPVIAAYKGACDSLIYISCNDNGAPAYLQAQLYFNDSSLANESIKIRVWKYNNRFGGSFGICAFEPQVDSNSHPSKASLLEVKNNCTFTRFTNLDYPSSGVATPSCGSYVGSDVWLKTVVPSSGQMVITTRNANIGNVSMAIYSGSLDSLILYTCNDNLGLYYLFPEVVINDTSLANDTLYLMFWRPGSIHGGAFEVCCFAPEIPDNLDCENAHEMEVKPSCNFDSFSNRYAQNSGDGLPSCAAYNGSDVWFKFIAPPSGEFTVSTRQSANANYGMSMYTGSCGSLTEYICDDNSSSYNNWMPEIAVQDSSLNGQTIYIQVWRRGDRNGLEFDLCVFGKLTPVIHQPNGAEICQGDEMPALSVYDGVFQYNWYSQASGGIALATDTNKYTPSQAGTYYVEAVNTLTLEKSARTAISLLVHPNPIFIGNTDVKQCSNEADKALSTTDLGYHYHWYSDSLLTNTLALDTNKYQAKTSGVYYVQAIDQSTQCASIASLKYQKIQAPELVNAIDQNACSNSLPHLLSVTDLGDNYRWYSNSNGTGLLSQTAEYLANNAGTFYIQSHDSNLCYSNLEAVNLEVNSSPLIPGAVDQYVCESELPISLSVQDLGYEYAWFLDRDEQQLVQYGPASMLMSQAGFFYIKAIDTSSNCSSNLDSMQLGVYSTPVAINPISFESCDSSGYNGLRVDPSYDYYWYTESTNGVLVASLTNVHYPATNGDYYVEAVDPASKCKSESRVKITLNIHPSKPPLIAYDGDSLHTNLALSYQWYKNGIAVFGATNRSYDVTESGQYHVVSIDSNVCEQVSETVEILPTAGLEGNRFAQLIEIYPNPASDLIRIKIPGELLGAKAELFNLQGSLVNSWNIEILKGSFSVRELPKGIYFLKFSKNGEVYSKRLIVQ